MYASPERWCVWQWATTSRSGTMPLAASRSARFSTKRRLRLRSTSSSQSQVDRAGNVAAAPRRHLAPGVFFGRTAVPHQQVRIGKPRKQLFGVGHRAATNFDIHVRRGGWRRRGCEWQSRRLPSAQAAIQIPPVGMANHVQRPSQPARPAAAFVVQHDDLAFGREADAPKQIRQASRARQRASGGGNAGHQLPRRHEHRPGGMRRIVGLAGGHLHGERRRAQRGQRVGADQGRLGRWHNAAIIAAWTRTNDPPPTSCGWIWK